VDGDGNASDWVAADALTHDPLVASVMGGLFSEQGRENFDKGQTPEHDTLAWMPRITYTGWEPLQQTDLAMVQAIEVLPEKRPTIRVDCGSDAEFVDWESDRKFDS
jgi:hypothetical protein